MMDRLNRPHYAYCLLQAALLAKSLGHKKITAIEFGVAKGDGLISLSAHANSVKDVTGIEIELFGFDLGKGLPKPLDYRDLPYQWKQGDFEMNNRVEIELVSQARILIGDIRDTLPGFFSDYSPSPIGAMLVDLDYYSSTSEALKILRAKQEYFLPRVFCYFDDVIGGDIELHNDFTGERLAINEFNETSKQVKLAVPYYLRSIHPHTWGGQIWIAHFFGHPEYNIYIARNNES